MWGRTALMAVASRFFSATNKDKSRILDEFIAITGR